MVELHGPTLAPLGLPPDGCCRASYVCPAAHLLRRIDPVHTWEHWVGYMVEN